MTNELRKALEDTRHAIFNLLVEMETYDGDVNDIIADSYISNMPYLPSFDEFYYDFATFVEEVTDEK